MVIPIGGIHKLGVFVDVAFACVSALDVGVGDKGELPDRGKPLEVVLAQRMVLVMIGEEDEQRSRRHYC